LGPTAGGTSGPQDQRRVEIPARRRPETTTAAASGALLQGPDEGSLRRTLARDAARGRWSVRELESRARAAGAPSGRARPRAKPALHPDQAAAIETIADALGAALGRDVDVTAAKASGYRVQITFESLDDALDAARRLRVRAVAG